MRAARALEIAALLGLDGSRADRLSATLSHGDQKLLDIALALALEPRVLLLDEPTAGMGPEERLRMMERVHVLWETQRLTLVFIEHDMDIVFRIADTIRVLCYGRVLAEGTPAQIRANPAVIERLSRHARGGRGMSVVLDARRRRQLLRRQPHPVWTRSGSCEQGQTLALLGRNGAGKSTTLKTIAGLVTAATGTDHVPRPRRDRGAAASPGPGWPRLRAGRPAGVSPAQRAGQPADRGQALARRRQARMDPETGFRDISPAGVPLRQRQAGRLSGGEQQMLAIARALMGNPTVILLDEPSEGLAPLVVASIGAVLRELRKTPESRC